MKNPVDTVRVSERGREILIKMKRRTGLEHWNELCRVAVCRSLANKSPPPRFAGGGDSSVEMEWKTFAGGINAEISALLLLRAHAEGIDTQSRDALGNYFRSHLERGISGLQNVRSISGMLELTDIAEA